MMWSRRATRVCKTRALIGTVGSNPTMTISISERI